MLQALADHLEHTAGFITIDKIIFSARVPVIKATARIPIPAPASSSAPMASMTGSVAVAEIPVCDGAISSESDLVDLVWDKEDQEVATTNGTGTAAAAAAADITNVSAPSTHTNPTNAAGTATAGTDTVPKYLNIALDISINSPAHTGIATTELVRTLMQALPPLGPAACLIKQFLKSKGLCDAFTGGIPSYGIVLLTLLPLLRRLRESRSVHPRMGSSSTTSQSTSGGYSTSTSQPSSRPSTPNVHSRLTSPIRDNTHVTSYPSGSSSASGAASSINSSCSTSSSSSLPRMTLLQLPSPLPAYCPYPAVVTGGRESSDRDRDKGGLGGSSMQSAPLTGLAKFRSLIGSTPSNSSNSHTNSLATNASGLEKFSSLALSPKTKQQQQHQQQQQQQQQQQPSPPEDTPPLQHLHQQREIGRMIAFKLMGMSSEESDSLTYPVSPPLLPADGDIGVCTVRVQCVYNVFTVCAH